ncbi:hypothetical protein [Desulforamulus aeronauticus]|uniref:Uncharacterized membrane protein, DUF485 family n=1 Tax=Desulforamulus aeronauticus DSM 10349 TaxID=1121421 RepID=A0A1M6NNK1_9FIRM|nr:hypothetical protein [Desulforamulus aeronauticus]SHJ97337.1 Uncharacterized membrane protein, DUF485 family [Desulforamulus aeronauticus DSM 10349]
MAKIETALKPLASTREDKEASLLVDIHSEQYLKLIMYRQLRLSLALFGVFFIILAGLPLVNYYLPTVANVRVFGFTISWLALGVLFYPVTWAVAYIYVKRSLKLEHQIAQEVAQSKGR